MQLTRTRRCSSCGRDVSTKLKSCPRCGADRNEGQSQDSHVVGGPPQSPLFRPEQDRSWSPETYLGYGAALTVLVLLLFVLGLGLGPIELLLLAPVSLLATVWLAIGIIAKGVEVGRRASGDR
jgi:hypothetical protein